MDETDLVSMIAVAGVASLTFGAGQLSGGNGFLTMGVGMLSMAAPMMWSSYRGGSDDA